MERPNIIEELLQDIFTADLSNMSIGELDLLKDKISICQSAIELLLGDTNNKPNIEPIDDIYDSKNILQEYHRSFTGSQREYLMKRDGGKCVYCGDKATEVDHVVPYDMYGPTIISNAVCCCPSCNRHKYNSLDNRRINFLTRGLYWLFVHNEDMSWVECFIPRDRVFNYYHQHLSNWRA